MGGRRRVRAGEIPKCVELFKSMSEARKELGLVDERPYPVRVLEGDDVTPRALTRSVTSVVEARDTPNKRRLLVYETSGGGVITRPFSVYHGFAYPGFHAILDRYSEIRHFRFEHVYVGSFNTASHWALIRPKIMDKVIESARAHLSQNGLMRDLTYEDGLALQRMTKKELLGLNEGEDWVREEGYVARVLPSRRVKIFSEDSTSSNIPLDDVHTIYVCTPADPAERAQYFARKYPQAPFKVVARKEFRDSVTRELQAGLI